MNVAARWIGIVAAALAGGCVNLGDGSHPEIHRHTVDAATGVAARPGGAPGIAVRSWGAGARDDVRVVRRDAADDFVYLEFDRWGEPPADAATDAVREGLAASGAFAFVSAAGDALAVERFLDGYVLGFDHVKSASGPWKARFSVRLSLSDKAGKLLHTAVYETTHDLPGASPVGVGPAMSAAVGDAVNRALADWAAAGALNAPK
jgi:ABC-type uncharacterized transport system auxiliary subunit